MLDLDPQSEALGMRQMIQKKRNEMQEEASELMRIEAMIMMVITEDPKDEFGEPYAPEKIQKLSEHAKKKFVEYFDAHPLKKPLLKNKQN